MKKIYYFDNAATSFPKPEKVYTEVSSFLKGKCANPGRSAHSMSLETARVIFQCRELIKKLFNAENSEQIIFTHNATEALNIAILGFLKRGSTVVTTSMEHNSVMRPLNFLKKTKNINILKIKQKQNGEIDEKDLFEKIKLSPSLVIVNHASNVNGLINNLEIFSNLKKKFHFKLLIDASQSAGVVNIDVKSLDIDFLAFTGHKSLYGIQGTGGLYVKAPDDIIPLKFGGTGSLSEHEVQPDFLPDKFESGTPNCPGIAALKAGVEFVMEKGVENIFNRKKKLVSFFVNELEKIPSIKIFYGNSVDNNIGVVSVNSKSLSPSSFAMELDKRFGIAVRAGLHCAPSMHKVLSTYPEGTVRFSFSVFHTKKDVEYALEAIKDIVTVKEYR